MGEYKPSYADKLSLNSIDNTLSSLIIWRDAVNDELASLIYSKSKLSTYNTIDPLLKERLTEIINKLEGLCNKEIELLSQLITSIENHNNAKNQSNPLSPSIIKRLEYARNNYNRITANIDKLTKSSSILLQLKQDYYHQRSPLIKQDMTIYSDIPMRQEIKITESIAQESNKNNQLLISEVNKELELLNDLSPSSQQLNKCKNNTAIKPTMKNQLENQNHIESPEEIMNQFAESLRITRYKPKQMYKTDLNNFLSNHQSSNYNHKQIKKSNSQSHMKIRKENSLSPMVYDSMNELMLTIQKIHINFEEAKERVKEGCVMQNEKSNYEKIVQENIQLNTDLENIKSCIGDIGLQYKSLIQKMTIMEEEQIELKNHNKKLIDYIKAKNLSYCGNYKHNNLDTNGYGYNNLNNNTVDDNSNLNHVFTSFGSQNMTSIDMMNNINKNIERKTAYML